MEYGKGNLTKSELNPFFYGVTLVHEPKSYTYQADAISANRQLSSEHYSEQHIYRVEWEPPAKDGSGGYIHWYTDGLFSFSVQGLNLELTGTEIPSEPMYLLMNTAVSHTWGFPAPCPDGCLCSCYECGNPDCACALPPGYCDNFPSHFEIDYVRVYQAVNESRHILGCSTKSRPTELFIKGHSDRYMERGQKHPLEPIRIGGAVCLEDSECGGPHLGICSAKGFCRCEDGFTGPTCLAHDGFYSVEDSSIEPVDVHSEFMVRFSRAAGLF
jgi:beta-glucan synthesis-associated protein KRE6